jgi:hypothetical protein
MVAKNTYNKGMFDDTGHGYWCTWGREVEDDTSGDPYTVTAGKLLHSIVCSYASFALKYSVLSSTR